MKCEQKVIRTTDGVRIQLLRNGSVTFMSYKERRGVTVSYGNTEGFNSACLGFNLDPDEVMGELFINLYQ